VSNGNCKSPSGDVLSGVEVGFKGRSGMELIPLELNLPPGIYFTSVIADNKINLLKLFIE